MGYNGVEVFIVTIGEIKKMLGATATDDLPAVLSRLESDRRAGVIKLVKSYQKWYNKACEEKRRLAGMLFFENKYAEWGHVCGVDEVGAGPLAGPVAAGAVILPPGCVIDGLNDSKKLSATKRGELYEVITQRAIAYAVAFVDNNVIDEINILQARMKAMALAVAKLGVRPDVVFIDGSYAPDLGVKTVTLGKDGDSRSMSVAAASVLAKVQRDALMARYHEEYPDYGFERNMGYGTVEHLAALRAHGPTPIHRRTFIGS